ncbi:hypothetical protein SLS57_012406 [Botryosphaeria dothidea]
MEASSWEPEASGGARFRPRQLPLESPSISSTVVRTSPYHAYLALLPTYETESLLADNVPSGKPSTIYYLEIASDGTLHEPEAFTSKFDGNCYWQGDDAHLAALRIRLETSVPYAQRIIVVENILPVIVELLGSSLNLRPRLFQQHVRDRWRSNDQSSRNAPQDADAMIPVVWIRPESFGVTIRVPRMIDAASLRPASSWQQKRLFSMLNDCDASPLLFQDDPVPCHPRVFEHVSVEILAEEEAQWTAIVLFPPNSDERLPFSRARKATREPAPPIPVSGYGENLSEFDAQTEHFPQWQAEYQHLSDTLSESNDPFILTASLYAHALGYWEIHVNTLDRIVQSLNQVLSLMRSSPAGDTGEIYPQQDLKELILSNISVLSDTLSHLESLIKLETLPGNRFSKLSVSSSALVNQHQSFAALQARLTRNLPIVQHHIDVVLSQQHILLAHTQLLESRKGIEQADTVKRLTALAFIFIPISTATSVFGMNIQELNPNPRIWVFLVTCAGLLAFALMGAYWNRLCNFSAELWRRVKDNLDESMDRHRWR